MAEQKKQFVGIGFGPIQSGLFLLEASRSGNFDRLTVADIDAAMVQAVRDNQGRYTVNVASATGISQQVIEGVRMLNPQIPEERAELIQALAVADEIATALPSIKFFSHGGEAAPAACLAAGLRQRSAAAPPAIIYTAENHNHAAEILQAAITEQLSGKSFPDNVQILNTVIGKMSGVITEAAEQRRLGIAQLTPGSDRAVLVEEFNRILISRIALPGFTRGITVFGEKADLLPFEEAKLYGHNAVHALLGYLAHGCGCRNMAEAAGNPELMAKAHEAFLLESGRGLRFRHGGIDPLFTEAGFRAYAEDLLARMTNPYLCDPVARVIRDPQRKLAWDDRLIGAMRLALQAGVIPVRFAEGVRAAKHCLKQNKLQEIWTDEVWNSVEAAPIRALISDDVLSKSTKD
jgi:mannitol-1-phosphate 5-dehydrogenase